ncbi:hypothetical protein ACU7AI_05215 [Pseudomonas aeruginosa]
MRVHPRCRSGFTREYGERRVDIGQQAGSRDNGERRVDIGQQARPFRG